jgi:hypothetical protein
MDMDSPWEIQRRIEYLDRGIRYSSLEISIKLGELRNLRRIVVCTTLRRGPVVVDVDDDARQKTGQKC